jgi:hypothetical protein
MEEQPSNQNLKDNLENLKKVLEGSESLSMLERFEILDEILELEDQLGISRKFKGDSNFECFGCGS